ncbi:hypothetical protein ANCCAN_13594 [Ancylostoma caninum]|uniref:Uncharacterized protein n=1 Tax=Ancylostoma caninum TaxID=29170 RepID=A0A368G7S9_ANCCA|nr:hypothetical protein ANCCAN_13594 [Ancylostoma caninum]
MNHLSQRTKHMQKRFLVNLCVQAAIPTFGLLIPLIIILKSRGFVLGQGCIRMKQKPVASTSELIIRRLPAQ